MLRFSASLDFLFPDLPLPDAIRAARETGFDAVECHWPYDTDREDISAALAETGLPMLGLNTSKGNIAAGDFGLSALPHRRAEARDAIEEAVSFAAAISCRAVHVMAGRAAGAAARAVFTDNLAHACSHAAPHGITILIEPLSTRTAPGYHLTSTDEALSVLQEVAAPNLKIMYDLFHMEIMQARHVETIRALLPHIGHIQFATVPNRRSPDAGAPDLAALLPRIASLGYEGWFGAEYLPEIPGNFDWLQRFRAIEP